MRIVARPLYSVPADVALHSIAREEPFLGRLDKVAAVIAAFPESNVLIGGYTDSKGSPRANLALSKKRAESVKDWLVKQKDISADIITAEGLGETKPIAPNDNPEVRQKTGG